MLDWSRPPFIQRSGLQCEAARLHVTGSILIVRSPGRSVSACRRAYDHLLTPSVAPPSSFQFAGPFNPQPPNPRPSKKRPAPSESSSTTGERIIQAQPFATVNAPQDPATFQAAIFPSAEQQGKKRGRPNKEEHERRVREAAERGEIYPPPKKVKTPRPSLENYPMGELSSAPATFVPTASDVSSSTKKSKKPKASSIAPQQAPQIPARTSSIEATSSAADPMRVDTEETAEKTMSQIQAPDFPAGESLLTEMREHAALTRPATIEEGPTATKETAPGPDPNVPTALTSPTAPPQEASTEHHGNET